MNDETILLPDIQPFPAVTTGEGDLDDLIFRDERWLISDR